MSISRDEVLHVARLARLELSEDELAAAVRDLGRILEYVERLGSPAADGDAAEETAGTPLREDEPRPGLTSEEATAPAPRAAEGLFRVPPVIGGP